MIVRDTVVDGSRKCDHLVFFLKRTDIYLFVYLVILLIFT